MRDLEAIESHAISYNTYGFIGLKLNAVPVIPQQNASPVFYVLLHLYLSISFTFLMDPPIGYGSICAAYLAYTPSLCP